MSATGTSASASASEAFRTDFNTYNGIHEGLKDRLSQYTINYNALGKKMVRVNELLEGTIEKSVAKKKELDKLKLRLPAVVTEYNTISVHTEENNVKLKELKVLIQLAVAAAAAKATQDASTAAQALADAREAIQTQIDALNALIQTRKTAFVDMIHQNQTKVNHIIDIVIPTNLKDIKQSLQAEHISQTTRDMVEGIETSIKTSIRDKFQSISTQFDAKHKTEIEAINEQITEWTYVKNGNDIKTMLSANASMMTLSSSTILNDFTSAVDELVNTELRKLDTAKAEVEAAIAVDKDTAVKRDIAVLLEHANQVKDSVKPFVDKLVKAEKIEVTTPSLNANLGAILGNAITTLEPFGRQVTEFNNQFEQMNQTMNESYKSSVNYLTLKETIDRLNELYKAQQSKYDILNDRYTSYKPLVATPPPDTRLSSAAPRRPASATAAPRLPASATATTSQRRSTSADAAAAALPRQAFTDAQFKPIHYTPSQDKEEEDYFIGAADDKSKPVTPPAPIIGARRNFLYVSHNTEPKTAYLVVVKKPRVGESKGGGGGNKNYHIQKGGAPPPDVLPEDSEIFSIDTNNPNFLDVMAGFIPPSDLLQVSPDGTNENKIISNIRSSGRRPKGDLNELYNNIKNELITEENQNPLTIGLRAVYYQNIIKLIRLLDYNLRHEGMSYEDMYEKLRKFMDYTYGTFGVLDALYKDTFHQGSLAPPPLPPISPPGSPPGSPRLSPRDHLKTIDSALKTKGRDAKIAIKKIVGWTSSTENTNFNMLTKMFSKECTHTGVPNTPNTFLNDDKKLGSSPYSYHKFRLNWIILLAFHSYYNKQSTLETVGKLIASLYNAFLGWLATSSYQDTFTRLFNKTLQIDPTTKYSEIFNKQLNASLNSENSSYKDVYTLVQNINKKMCELQDDRIPAIDVEHLEEYNDEMNDPDYVPDGNESDDSYGDTSPRRRAVAAEARLLSPPEEGLGRTRSKQLPSFTDRRGPMTPRRGPMTPEELRQSERLPPPDGDPNPDLDDFSDVEESAERPTVSSLTLPGGQSLGGPLSDRTGYPYERTRKSLFNLKQAGVRTGTIPAGPARPSSSPSSSQSGSVSERLGAVSTHHSRANRDVEMTPGALPLAVIEQQQRSQPNVLTRPRKPLSVGLSYRPPAAPTSTPAAPASTPAAPASTPAAPTSTSALKPNPPSTVKPNFGRTSASSQKRLQPDRPPKGGGNNKKRTRKHKKHTSISASRRPTRRRRNPPTEGQKYTRKRPRT